MGTGIIPQPTWGRYRNTLGDLLPDPAVSSIFSLVHSVAPSLISSYAFPYLPPWPCCRLTTAQAESVIPAQPILLIIGKPAFVLEGVGTFLRSLAAIGIPILEGGGITGKIIDGSCTGSHWLRGPSGARCLLRGCASRQCCYKKTCRD